MGSLAGYARGRGTQKGRSTGRFGRIVRRFDGPAKNSGAAAKSLPTKCDRRQRIQQRLALLRERGREEKARSSTRRVDGSRARPIIDAPPGCEKGREVRSVVTAAR